MIKIGKRTTNLHGQPCRPYNIYSVNEAFTMAGAEADDVATDEAASLVEALTCSP